MGIEHVMPDGQVLSDSQFRLGELLGFLNRRDVGGRLKDAQALINSCLSDIADYGRRLFEIEEDVRRRLRAKKQHPAWRGTMPWGELAKLDAVRELNGKFDCKHFEEAVTWVQQRKLKFGYIDFRPPRFFGFYLKPADDDEGASRILDFLSICGKVDPRLWGTCSNPECRSIFVNQRRRATTSYCSDPCRYSVHNKQRARKSAKKSHARKRRSVGDSRYFR